jgi:hypothetical protein
MLKSINVINRGYLDICGGMMAKPRVFVSSTFFDLRQIRENLERMIRDLGYEPILNETGGVPYKATEALEASAYREVETSDIIVSVIGGRYGTEAITSPGFSISQEELKHAVERGIQVFIFIDRNVDAEYSTYARNKGAKIEYAHVDDKRVYEFIETIKALPRNNAIATFATSSDIIDILKAQWAGLFQRFLQEQQRRAELKVLDEMKSVSQTLKDLVDFLTLERENKDLAIQSILLLNHPAFRRFKEVTATPYRVIFTDRTEFVHWMTARNWKLTPIDRWDPESTEEWTNTQDRFKNGYLKITREMFDDTGRLINLSEWQWDDDAIKFVEYDRSTDPPDDDPPDDDL